MNILKYEKLFKDKGYKNIVGIDEAGRGPLAGPVVAVAINWGENDVIAGIKDSKVRSANKKGYSRQTVASHIPMHGIFAFFKSSG